MKFQSYKDMIEYIKPFAIDIMTKYNIPCSVTISILMNECIHNQYTITKGYQQKYLDLLKSKNLTNNNVILSLKNALKLLCENNYDQIITIIEDFSLTEIDVEVQDKYLLNQNHIIDTIVERPIIDHYIIKKNNRIILQTSNWQEAHHIATIEQGIVYNSYGDKVYDNTPKLKKNPVESKVILHNKIEAGQKISVQNANLYKEYSDKIPNRCVSGIFQIVNGRKLNNRYLLSTIGEESYEIGYINVKDLKDPSV